MITETCKKCHMSYTTKKLNKYKFYYGELVSEEKFFLDCKQTIFGEESTWLSSKKYTILGNMEMLLCNSCITIYRINRILIIFLAWLSTAFLVGYIAYKYYPLGNHIFIYLLGLMVAMLGASAGFGNTVFKKKDELGDEITISILGKPLLEKNYFFFTRHEYSKLHPTS